VKARAAAEALFSSGKDMSDVPTVSITRDKINSPIIDILAETKMVGSKGEARRLIEQGGLSINGVRVTEISTTLTEVDFAGGSVLVKRGKKNYNKIIIE